MVSIQLLKAALAEYFNFYWQAGGVSFQVMPNHPDKIQSFAGTGVVTIDNPYLANTGNVDSAWVKFPVLDFRCWGSSEAITGCVVEEVAHLLEFFDHNKFPPMENQALGQIVVENQFSSKYSAKSNLYYGGVQAKFEVQSYERKLV